MWVCRGYCLKQLISLLSHHRARVVLAMLFLLISKMSSAAPSGEWPLHEAAERGDINAAAKALKQGADINGRNDRGLTPLMVAPWSGSLPMVKFLVEKGADVNATTDKGLTPLAAAAMKHPGIAKYLIENGADVNAPFRMNDPKHEVLFMVGLAYLSSMDMTRLVFSKGLTEKNRDLIWSDAIHLLPSLGTEQGFSPQLGFFIDKGANVNAPVEKDGTTPLMYAAKGSHVELVRIFIAKGADVNARAAGGHTALKAATQAKSNKDEIIEILKKAGARE